MEPTFITGNDINRIMTEIGVPSEVTNPYGVLADANYMMPTIEWFQYKFVPAWNGLLKFMELSQYVPEAFDCDDYARLCAAFAGILNARTVLQQNLGPRSLALGEFWYRPPSGGHAMNFFLHKLDGVIKVQFFEPQAGVWFRQPTKEDLKTVFMVRV